jgi:hypothetical protein
MSSMCSLNDYAGLLSGQHCPLWSSSHAYPARTFAKCKSGHVSALGCPHLCLQTSDISTASHHSQNKIQAHRSSVACSCPPHCPSDTPHPPRSLLQPTLCHNCSPHSPEPVKFPVLQMFFPSSFQPTCFRLQQPSLTPSPPSPGQILSSRDPHTLGDFTAMV